MSSRQPAGSSAGRSSRRCASSAPATMSSKPNRARSPDDGGMISDRALDRLSAMFRGPDVAGTRYELLSLLGRSGMGAVYLARDSALDREVALKVVDRPSADEETLDRLAREARILARLEHPG